VNQFRKEIFFGLSGAYGAAQLAASLFAIGSGHLGLGGQSGRLQPRVFAIRQSFRREAETRAGESEGRE
jgi:hypothetical protein